MRRVPDGRDLDGEDILMDGQTANKKPAKDQTQVEIPMDGFELPGGFLCCFLVDLVAVVFFGSSLVTQICLLIHFIHC